MDTLQNAGNWLLSQLTVWNIVGLFGQCLFFMRFVVQWIASEKQKKSVIPVAFWYFSLAGGLIVLAYAIHKKEPVFILGQAPGVFIYSRNLYFIWTHKRAKKTIA
ncbi:MAG TPA: lipid-A-disaccharide synthase N-terminal domain-containing protein [Alphaproteobacteria bacterium]|nr:lipid-A-disaccharide synthase N-terminal domain-containing protein [Alphaproteobacteria bacterium]